MPIGAYDPWIRNHGNPEQAVTMADQAGARRFVPTHCSTFRLGDEPLDEPVARLEAALAREAGRRARRRPGEYRVAA
jgi:L-ascorbate metabolism protein UlaG (beta-lactamase superfamily)